MNGGIARSNTTDRPGSSTSQPMIRSVSGHSFSADASDPREAVLAARHDRRRRAVAEQSGCDHRGRVVAVEADGDRAGLDGDEQPIVPGSADASRAAIDRPLTPPAQPRPKTGTRRTSGRKPTRWATRASRLGVAMPVVDTATIPSMSVGLQSGLFDRRGRRVDEQLLGGFQIDGVAVMPAVLLHIPVGRSDDVAPGDAGIVEHARKAVEQRLLAAESLAGTAPSRPLVQ